MRPTCFEGKYHAGALDAEPMEFGKKTDCFAVCSSYVSYVKTTPPETLKVVAVLPPYVSYVKTTPPETLKVVAVLP